MSRDNLFWGLLLLIAGGILLASNLGYFAFDLRLLWPLFIILLGVYILLGQSYYSRGSQGEDVTVPLDDASEAFVHIEHGAGSLRISGSGKKDELLSGHFHNVDLTTDKSGKRLSARLRSTFSGGMFWVFPWNWGHRGHEWDFSLNSDIPLTLDIDTGASENHLDFRELKLDKLELDTGASSTHLILPEKGGHSRVKIGAGAASLDITIPKGVAADIRVESGLASLDIDQTRFPRSGKHYTSPDYEKAINKIDLRLETGVSSVKIR